MSKNIKNITLAPALLAGILSSFASFGMSHTQASLVASLPGKSNAGAVSTPDRAASLATMFERKALANVEFAQVAHRIGKNFGTKRQYQWAVVAHKNGKILEQRAQ